MFSKSEHLLGAEGKSKSNGLFKCTRQGLKEERSNNNKIDVNDDGNITNTNTYMFEQHRQRMVMSMTMMMMIFKATTTTERC